MRKETLEALTGYEKAWKASLNAKDLSIIQLYVVLARESASFSELVQKTRISSRTLDKWLKNGIKRGFIYKKRQGKFPWKSTYSFTEEAKFIKITGRYIQSFDDLYRNLIEGAGEELASVEELIDRAMKYRRGCLELIFMLDPSWLKGVYFEYVQMLCSAINSISFWGTFFALNFPHIKKKAKKFMQKKGFLPSSTEEEIFKVVAIPSLSK